MWRSVSPNWLNLSLILVITDIVSMAVPPGMRADEMQTSLEKLFTEVVPRVKAEVSRA